MASSNYLDNQFLIAMPTLDDPNFARVVSVVCQHGEDGALGIVVNRPAQMQLGDLLEQLEIKVEVPGIAEQPIFVGGPVQQDRGFVLHETCDEYDSSYAVADNLRLTTSRDVLEAIAQGRGPKRHLVALGYAGWSSGQLEEELKDNAWLSTPVDLDLLFDTPSDQRWAAATALLGFDPMALANYAGHA